MKFLINSRKIIKGCKTLVRNIPHKNANPKLAASDLSLNSLKADTYCFTFSKFSQPSLYTPPKVFEGSYVPMHHDLNGGNCHYRAVYRFITTGKNSKGKLVEQDEIQKSAQLYLPSMLEADKAFAKLPPLEKDFVVYRGRAEYPNINSLNSDFQIIANANVGDRIIPDAAYSYTAFDWGIASSWKSSMGARTMMQRIFLPKGAKVSRNLEHKGEVVMPRNAEYKLLSKEIEDDFIAVDLEYILPKKDNVAEIKELMRKFNIQEVS